MGPRVLCSAPARYTEPTMKPALKRLAFENLRQDLRLAARGIRKNPGIAATVVLTLALGIGANTAVFSLVHTLMLRPLPVRAPGELVELLSDYPNDPRLNVFGWEYYEHFRDNNHVFSELTGVAYSNFEVSFDGGEAQVLEGAYVVGDFFQALGIEAALGRMIEPPDDELGSPGAAVAVLSWSFWRSRFDLDAGVIGNQIVVSGAPATVIGVAKRGFSGLQVGAPKDLWIPAAMEVVIRPRACEPTATSS